MQKLNIREIFLRNIDNFKDKNIIVGFSGGADSTALLMLFHEFKDYLIKFIDRKIILSYTSPKKNLVLTKLISFTN